jgi:hypothetical protein
MFESQPENNSRPTMQVVLGFLLGVLIALGCLFFSIFLGTALAWRERWLFPVFTGIGLGVAGIVAFRRMKESGYAFGIVIALSIAVLVDAACGVALYR